jgi:hypothetical protein
MRKYYFIFIFICLNNLLEAQHEGNTWVLGYTYNEKFPLPSNEKFGMVNMMFYKSPYPKYFRELNRGFIGRAVNASICTDSNQVRIFYNGMNVYNRDYKVMKNGDSINHNKTSWWTPYDVFRQEGLLLPFPGKKKQYVLLHSQAEYFKNATQQLRIAGMRVYVSIIDLDKENGLGAVTSRKKLLISDTIDVGRIAGVRHANGRDWWVIIQKNYKNQYYKILINEQGVNIHDIQTIGNSIGGGGGQSVFSPDGKMYFALDVEATDIFDFDRCTGMLSNHKKTKTIDGDFYGSGVAISPNSRFLYASLFQYLYQYDLWAADIEKSKILIAQWDGFKNENGLSSHFDAAQLAPNGKIYIACRGAIQYLHVINEPDKLGTACNFVQRGVELPSYHAYGLPNHPNFALGALKGSPCDTLHSIATQDIDKQEDVIFFPNPVDEVLNINISNNHPATLIVRDISGRVIETTRFTAQTTISTVDYFNGMIFCEIWQDNKRISTERIVIQHE